jgi:hypothetical protein
MRKGIVMEIDDTHLTLLTPDGEFLHAQKRNQPYSIGEEILFVPINLNTIQRPHLFHHLFKIKSLGIAFAALLLILGSLFPMYQANKAYAYMSIDVNPSIELGVNKKMQVVKLAAYNIEGKKILSRLNDWKKEGISQITQSILNEMNKQGFLQDNHVVVISTVRTEKREEQAEKRLTKNLNKIKEEIKEKDLELTVVNGTEKDMEKAHHLGITTGKYKEQKMSKLSNNEIKNQKHEMKNAGKDIKETNKINKQPLGQINKNMDNSAVNKQVPAEKRTQPYQKNSNQGSPGQINKQSQRADDHGQKHVYNRGKSEIKRNYNENRSESQSNGHNHAEKNNEHHNK